MAKKYHPDMKPLDGSHEPSLEKFRDIAEAYAVLSVKESRANYDLSRRKNPDHYSSPIVAERNTSGADRNKTGIYPTERPAPGSYAEERLAELKEEREKFNVNHLGYFNGGVPTKHGNSRGKAIRAPGQVHDPAEHNFFEHYHQDSNQVTSEDAVMFKNWMSSDKFDFNLSRPHYKTYYDRNMEFMADRKFWMSLLMAGSVVVYWYNKY